MNSTLDDNSSGVMMVEGCRDLNEARSPFDWTVNTAVQIIFTVAYTITIPTGLIANACVIYVVCRVPSLHTVRNLFIVSLACSDFMVCLTSGIVTPLTAFYKRWLFGAILCRVTTFVQGLSIGISTYTLAAIAFDRYVLIVRPTWRPISARRATYICAGVWLLAGAMVAPPVAFRNLQRVGVYCGEFCFELWPDPRIHSIYGMVSLCVQFAFPLTVITACYVAVSAKVTQSMRVRSSNRRGEQLRKASAMNRVLVGVVVAFVICWFVVIRAIIVYLF